MRKYRLAELKNGLMHPVFGPDHLLAMICVGIVSVQLGGHNIWRIPLAFVAGMTVGGALGIQQVSLPFTELGIAASVLVLGMGVIFAHRHMSPWPDHCLDSAFRCPARSCAWRRDSQVRESGALYARLPDRHLGAAHLWHADRRSGLDAKMALEGIAFHRRRRDGVRRGVLAANICGTA